MMSLREKIVQMCLRERVALVVYVIAWVGVLMFVGWPLVMMATRRIDAVEIGGAGLVIAVVCAVLAELIWSSNDPGEMWRWV